MNNPRFEPIPPVPVIPSSDRFEAAKSNAPRELPTRENTDRFERLMERPKVREREQTDKRTNDAASEPLRSDEQRLLKHDRIDDQQDASSQEASSHEASSHEASGHEGGGEGEPGAGAGGQSGFGNGGSQGFLGSMSDGANLTFAELIKQSTQMTHASAGGVDSQLTQRSLGEKSIQSLVNEVVDRIAISNTKGIEQEVRIQVRESLLAATEIRILQQHGQLQVQIMTGRADSFDLLSANQAELVTQLNQKLNRPVEVQLSFGSQSSMTQHDQTSGGDPEERQRSSDAEPEEQ